MHSPFFPFRQLPLVRSGQWCLVVIAIDVLVEEYRVSLAERMLMDAFVSGQGDWKYDEEYGK